MVIKFKEQVALRVKNEEFRLIDMIDELLCGLGIRPIQNHICPLRSNG